MSVLFKQYWKKTKDFDAFEHLNILCDNSGLELAGYSLVSYQKGWTNLIQSFIQDIKDFPIKLTEVDDIRGQLEINFEMINKRQETKVWRLLNYYKILSRNICMECGNESTQLKAIELNKRFCQECYEMAAMIGKTGTWLDRY